MPKIRVLNDDVMLVRKFLKRYKFTSDQYYRSYPQWSRGGSGWHPFRQGGTYIMNAIMWYHYVYKNNSMEWRPSIIIRAVLREARKYKARLIKDGE